MNGNFPECNELTNLKKHRVLHLVGYILAIFIGFCLGLIGGGGSILVIPVLVMCFGIDPLMATTYSLFIVGFTALAGAIGSARCNYIDYPKLIRFGIASVIALVLVRRYLMPVIPPVIFKSGRFQISKELLVMLCFSTLMLIAGIRMISQRKTERSGPTPHPSRLPLQGAMTGAITGFIGIGGGFIIVPSLVLFAGLDMKRAIGTSLAIITLNCIVGLISNPVAVQELDFSFLILFSALTILGILAGSRVTKYVDNKTLKPLFGWIILGMCTLVVARMFWY